jgi:hypothetical protein
LQVEKLEEEISAGKEKHQDGDWEGLSRRLVQQKGVDNKDEGKYQGDLLGKEGQKIASHGGDGVQGGTPPA